MASGTKRASPGAEDEKNPLLGVELDEASAKKLEEVAKTIQRVELLLERQAQAKLVPVYAQRREIVKSIDKFWLVALLNHSLINFHTVHNADRTALSYLNDVWVERDSVEPRCYTIEFHFKENPYFSDNVLTKSCTYVPPEAAANETADENGIKDSMLEFSWERDVKHSSAKIQWKDGDHNLTKLYPRVSEEDEVVDAGSFFNFFEEENDSFDLGNTIVNDVYPEAIDYFLGKAAVSDSDDEEDSDDDEGSVDLEKPKIKKQKV